MFIRYILKNMRRSAVTNALFCLLLALAGALLTLSAGLWYSVYQTERNLDEMITTIALPDMYAIRRYAKNATLNGDFTGMETTWGIPLEDYYNEVRQRGFDSDTVLSAVMPHVESHIMNQIDERIYQSGAVSMDDRRSYGGFAPGIDSVPFYVPEGSRKGTFIEMFPQYTAAFIVSCVGVDEVFEYNYKPNEPVFTRSFIADFKVEQDLYVHHGRKQTQTVTGYFPFTNADGSFPVEEGKRYVIVGNRYFQSGTEAVPNPDWYYALPPNRNMPNALYILPTGTSFEFVNTGQINSMYEFPHNVMPYLSRNGINADILPVTVRDRIPEANPDLGYEGYTWFELEDTLEDALASDMGEQLRTALSVAEVSHNSLVVLTTNDINSFLRFNQRTNKITVGRPFSAAEIAGGARVCVISEQLADINGLSVGDLLPLRLYPIVFGHLSSGGDSIWPPSTFDPKTDLTEPYEYTIVGVYSGQTQELRDHSITANTVIIPAASFEAAVFDGEENDPVALVYSSYDPPLLNTIIVPNDGIEEGKAAIESVAEGYGGFFRFFDQGYSTLKPVLSNLRLSMIWILAISAAGWIIAVAMFSLFYIGRKKTDVALLYAIGVSKKRGFLWSFIQSAAVIIIAHCAVMAVSVSFFRNILDASVLATRSFTEFYRDFTLSDMNIAGGVRLALPLDTSLIGVIMATLGITALLLLTAMFFSARASKPRFGKQGE